MAAILSRLQCVKMLAALLSLGEGNPGDHSGMGSANERQGYIVTLSLTGSAHTQNDPWNPLVSSGLPSQ